MVPHSGSSKNAGVAQLVEQLICNQQVIGSNPFASSIYFNSLRYFQKFLICLRLHWGYAETGFPVFF